jgi:F-type H+-transporting ATPase subunit b
MDNWQGLLLWAVEEGEEERTGLDLVLPETAEFFWATVAFAIVAVVLMKVAFPKIRAAVEARESQISGELKSAEDQKAESQRLLDEYKAQLAEARSESNKIIEEARASAESVRKDLIAKAETDAQGVVARAHEQIEAERTRTMQELQGQVASLAVQLAEKVVGRSLDRSSQTDLVNEYISQVGSMDRGSNN